MLRGALDARGRNGDEQIGMRRSWQWVQHVEFRSIPREAALVSLAFAKERMMWQQEADDTSVRDKRTAPDMMRAEASVDPAMRALCWHVLRVYAKWGIDAAGRMCNQWLVGGSGMWLLLCVS